MEQWQRKKAQEFQILSYEQTDKIFLSYNKACDGTSEIRVALKRVALVGKRSDAEKSAEKHSKERRSINGTMATKKSAVISNPFL